MWDWTCAGLPNAPDCQTLPTLTYGLTGTFFFNCFYIWAAQVIRGVCHLDVSFVYWLRDIRPLSSLIIICSFCEIINVVCSTCQQHLRMFVSQYNSCVGTLNSVAKTSGLGSIFLNCQSTRIARVSASGLKEFGCLNKHNRNDSWKYL